MQLRINTKDVASGVFLVLVALVGLYLNQDHSLGTARRMGPGYMPMLVFWLQAGLGAAVILFGVTLLLGGIPAVRVVSELDRLTSDLDWMTLPQRYILLETKLTKLTADLDKATKDSGFDPDLAKIYLASLQAALEQVDKARERASADMEVVTNAQAKVLMSIVEKAFYATLGALKERYPELPAEELEAEMRENLVWVAAEVDAESRKVIE